MTFESKVKVDTWANIVSRVDYLTKDGLTVGALRLSYDFIKQCISKKELKIFMDPQGIWLTNIDGKTHLIPIDIVATKDSYLRAENSLEKYFEIINKKVDLLKIDALTELYYLSIFEPSMWSFIEKHHGKKNIRSCVRQVSKRNTCMKKKPLPVLQPWVCKLNWKSQTGLISAVRGIDNVMDDDLNEKAKGLTRVLRGIILNNADKSTVFMTDVQMLEDDVIEVITKFIKIKEDFKVTAIVYGICYNEHWVDHIIMAIKIIAKWHPKEEISTYWISILNKLKDL